MAVYNVPIGPALLLMDDNRLEMKRILRAVIQDADAQGLEMSVLPDHVHLIILADDEPTPNELVRKIKGSSSKQFREFKGWQPGQKIWARKLNRKPLEDEDALYRARTYVRNNYRKHAEQWGIDPDEED